MAHQAVEKALKATVLAVTREYPPMTHNLRLLTERAGAPVPAAVASAVLRLGPHYTASRYPDAADGAPESSYNREIARALLKDSDLVLGWATGLISREAGDRT